MRRIFPVILCLFAFSICDIAHAGIIDDIRAERGLHGDKKATLSERRQMQLERQQQLQEAAAARREAREAAQQEKQKALNEARAAKAAAQAEKLAALKEAQTAKAAAFAEQVSAKQAALAEQKAAALVAKEAMLAAKLAEKQAKDAEKQAKLEAEKQAKEAQRLAALAPSPEQQQQTALHQEWESNLDGWIDTDEGTRPPPRQEVDLDTKEAPGTLIIDTKTRRLYLVVAANRAIQYGIGVGRPGFEWMGVKSVTRKEEWPDWRPPEEMIGRRPDLPRFMPGGPTNPLGARAMYLGSTLYRIHGSNEPESIGQAVSSGCFRMVNADVIDLYSRVQVGAKVIVR